MKTQQVVQKGTRLQVGFGGKRFSCLAKLFPRLQKFSRSAWAGNKDLLPRLFPKGVGGDSYQPESSGHNPLRACERPMFKSKS